MHKGIKIVILGLMTFFVLLFAWGILRYFITKMGLASYRPPPQVVSAEKVSVQNWRPHIPAIGTMSAVNGVTVSAEQSGNVVRINFISGHDAKEGDILVVLDDNIEQAQLQSAIAKANLAFITFQRNKNLLAQKAVSTEAFDQAKSSYDQAVADKNQVQAVIEQKHIRAPFTGRLGIRQVNLGQYISPGQAIVSLQAMDPLYVNFSLPEQHLHSLYLQQALELQTQAVLNKTFLGKISALNSTVDQQTHNILVQGTVANPDSQLYPGLFVNVAVELPPRSQVIVVPQTAVTFSLFGSTVYVVYKDTDERTGRDILRAKRVAVSVGEQRNDKVVIDKGLKPNDTIVTSGQVKLEDGVQIEIKNPT